MDRRTVDVYEASASAYRTQRSAYRPGRAETFAAALPAGSLRLDLGSGPGLYADLLGSPLVAADAAHAMLREAGEHTAVTMAVQSDLVSLPFRAASFAGVWASKAHQHVPAIDLPPALAELHRVMAVGGRLDMTMFRSPDGSEWTTAVSGEDDSFPGRLFTFWNPEALRALLAGAGFVVVDLLAAEAGPDRLEVTARRERTLADSVGAGMRMLLCGLNPSLYSADAGVGYARPGNRFWPAIRAAGLTDIDRDAHSLLRRDRIGMTDLVKRATVAAAELDPSEYRAGLERVVRLCRLLEPERVCFVGLAGWRAAVDRKAQPGWQPEGLGTTPVYVMPSTSGLNARTSLAALVEHLGAAIATPPPDRAGSP